MNVRRILIALDASRPSLAALDAAAGLAARWEAELVAIFVEDLDLLRLAGLPFAQAVGSASAPAWRFGASAMERTLERMAARARAAVALAAERIGVHWSFRVVRGAVVAELATAARDVDLVALGRAGAERRRAAGSTALGLLEAVLHPVLLLRHGAPIGGPVVVLLDGTDAALRAVQHAAALARACNGKLVLWPIGGGADIHRTLREAEKLPELAGLRVGRHEPTAAAAPSLGRALARSRCGTLVVPLSDGAADLRALLEAVTCPVLVVR